MATGPLAGEGANGDGSRERRRWSESKVFTRKSHKSNPNPNSNPRLTSDAPIPSLRISPVVLRQHDIGDRLLPQIPSDDASSSLNYPRSVTINLAPRSKAEARELRWKLTSELEQVRSLSGKLEAREAELQLSVPSASAAAGYTHSQLSVSDPGNRAPPASCGPHHRQLSVSVAAENGLAEAAEKEKRTPRANQYYRNSDFLLGKEKLQLPNQKKPKTSKKLALGDMDMAHVAPTSKAFKNCGSLLSKLMKHKFGWVFNKPVDVKGLGLQDYYTVIKHPMDLGTVKSLLDKNQYKSPREFAEDVRLTFSNAMTYNAVGQDVYHMAEELSRIFEERWPTIEAEFAYLSPPPPAKKAPPLDTRVLERSDSTAHPMAVDAGVKPQNHAAHAGRPPASKKPKAKDPHKRDMTFEEKQKLSNNLQNLPAEKLDTVVQIIKKRNSTLNQHDDEIEVDIDSVDVETLWELDRFVTNYKKSLSKNKKKTELSVLAGSHTNQNAGEDVVEKISEPVVAEVTKESNTVVDEKEVVSSSPVKGDKQGDNGSRSSSSSSSSSGSGSSSSDSESDSSSAYGSDARQSPGT